MTGDQHIYVRVNRAVVSSSTSLVHLRQMRAPSSLEFQPILSKFGYNVEQSNSINMVVTNLL